MADYVGCQAERDRQPPQPGHRHGVLPHDARGGVRHRLRPGVVHRARPRAGDAPRLAVRRMTRVYLVRHGRAAAGWDRDPDPDLDELGRAQAAAAADRLEALGCARAARRDHQPAAALPANRGGVVRAVGDRSSASRMRSPRSRRRQVSRWSSGSSGCAPRCGGTWAELGEPYTTFRDGVVARIRALDHDTVAFSHFVAINAVIGACLGDDRLVIRRLDNCSITVVDVDTAAGSRWSKAGTRPTPSSASSVPRSVRMNAMSRRVGAALIVASVAARHVVLVDVVEQPGRRGHHRRRRFRHEHHDSSPGRPRPPRRPPPTTTTTTTTDVAGEHHDDVHRSALGRAARAARRRHRRGDVRRRSRRCHRVRAVAARRADRRHRLGRPVHVRVLRGHRGASRRLGRAVAAVRRPEQLRVGSAALLRLGVRTGRSDRRSRRKVCARPDW